MLFRSRSPDKRCGKSRVLDLLSLLAFNASPKTVKPTEASLFRSPSQNGGTLLLDEVEDLQSADSDTAQALGAVLNNGFEKNGTAQRMEKGANGNFHLVNFETFCPRVLAGINKTYDTLADRSIPVLMQRKLRKEKLERFSPDNLTDEVQTLRDRCYTWVLTHVKDLAAVYDTADKSFPALDPLDDRAKDLWEPLVSVVSVAGGSTLLDELTQLANDLSETRDGAGEDAVNLRVLDRKSVV